MSIECSFYFQNIFWTFKEFACEDVPCMSRRSSLYGSTFDVFSHKMFPHEYIPKGRPLMNIVWIKFSRYPVDKTISYTKLHIDFRGTLKFPSSARICKMCSNCLTVNGIKVTSHICSIHFLNALILNVRDELLNINLRWR